MDEEALSELSDHARGILLAKKLPPVTLLGAVDVEGGCCLICDDFGMLNNRSTRPVQSLRNLFKITLSLLFQSLFNHFKVMQSI
jgi:hypothetical protein